MLRTSHYGYRERGRGRGIKGMNGASRGTANGRQETEVTVQSVPPDCPPSSPHQSQPNYGYRGRGRGWGSRGANGASRRTANGKQETEVTVQSILPDYPPSSPHQSQPKESDKKKQRYSWGRGYGQGRGFGPGKSNSKKVNDTNVKVVKDGNMVREDPLAGLSQPETEFVNSKQEHKQVRWGRWGRGSSHWRRGFSRAKKLSQGRSSADVKELSVTNGKSGTNFCGVQNESSQTSKHKESDEECQGHSRGRGERGRSRGGRSRGRGRTNRSMGEDDVSHNHAQSSNQNKFLRERDDRINHDPSQGQPIRGYSRGSSRGKGYYRGRGHGRSTRGHGRGAYGTTINEGNHVSQEDICMPGFSLTELENLVTSSSYNCLVETTTDTVFRETLESLCEPPPGINITPHVDLIFIILRKALSAVITVRLKRQICLLKSLLLEDCPSYLQMVCFGRLLNGIHNPTSLEEQSQLGNFLELYLDICQRLETLDVSLTQALHGSNIVTLLQIIPDNDLYKEVAARYAKAVSSYTNTKSANQEIQKSPATLGRSKRRVGLRNGLVITDKRPRSNFRHEYCHPTKKMFLDEIVELRGNHRKGAFENDADYLDVQFRLLREDLVTSLRTGVQEYRQHGELVDSDARILKGIEIVAPFYGKEGFTYILSLNRRDPSHKRFKQHAGNTLKYGSLICITTDGFKDAVIFATIINNDKCESKGVFEIKILPYSEKEFDDICGLEGSDIADIMISGAYFEPYRHVLKALQAMLVVPFSQYIVRVETRCPQVPRYLRTAGKPYILFGPNDNALSKQIKITTSSSWPRPEKLGLNQSQFEAFKLALTTELAIIQGPPGTGKTYVGSKVAQVLLYNLYDASKGQQNMCNRFSKLRLGGSNRSKSIRTPLLIVCYTNHALDQFMERILDFCDEEDVLRVGGRSKSERLTKCGFKSKPRRKSHGFRQLMEQVETMQENYNFHDVIAECEQADILLLPCNVLMGVMGSFFQLEFNRLAGAQRRATMDQFKNALYTWLGCVDAKKPSNNAKPISDGDREQILKSEDSSSGDESEGSSSDDDSGDSSDSSSDDSTECGSDDEATESNENEDNAKTLERTREHQDRLLEEDEDGTAPDYSQFIKKKQNKSSKSAAEDVDADDFTKVVRRRKQKAAAKLILQELQKSEVISDERLNEIIDMKTPIDSLNNLERWDIYRKWRCLYKLSLKRSFLSSKYEYNSLQEELQEIRREDMKFAIQMSTVVGMTTTGAARYQSVLEEVGPEIVIIEEAAEVLEAHVIASLSQNCKHLILIGDHQQLRPNPSVYTLAKNFDLELSLFERLIKNDMKYVTLNQQHRMRPEISQFLKFIYPELRDAETVHNRPSIIGVASPVLFINHNELENSNNAVKSKQNDYEAKYIVALCRYLMQQGYKSTNITVITMYVAQLLKIKDLMRGSGDEFKLVLVTSVDNYQGEENEIILLSLVRSNTRGNLGFVEIENRICVALSRARNGMYVIGNMDMLKGSKSDLWRKILTHAESQKLVRRDFPTQCLMHQTGQLICKSEDFKTKAPNGGCRKICNELLKCSHRCTQYCHARDRDHKEFKCEKPCEKVFSCDHPCPDLCFVKCRPCGVPKPVVIPECGHDQTIQCHQSEVDVRCLYPVQIRCGKCQKSKTIPCYQHDEWQCDIPCGGTLACRHRCPGICDQCSNGCAQCQIPCRMRLTCGHMCTSSCSSPNPCPPCTAKCYLRCLKHGKPCQLPCAGHAGQRCSFNCSDGDGNRLRCGRAVRCKHQKSACESLCEEPCTFKPCEEQCTEKAKCPKCKKEARCQSVCKEQCHFICPKCNKKDHDTVHDDILTITLPCGHIHQLTMLKSQLDFLQREQLQLQLQQLPRCPSCGQVILLDRFWVNCVSASSMVEQTRPLDSG